MSRFEERRLLRLESARKPKPEWRLLFGPDYPTRDALEAEAARLEVQGVRVWTVVFVEPE